jgi:hypothetical protein
MAFEIREDIKGKVIEKSCTSKATPSIKTTGINLEVGEASGPRGGRRLYKINFNIRNLAWVCIGFSQRVESRDLEIGNQPVYG